MQAVVRFAMESDVGKSELCAALDVAGGLVIERLMNVCVWQKVGPRQCKIHVLLPLLPFSVEGFWLLCVITLADISQCLNCAGQN